MGFEFEDELILEPINKKYWKVVEDFKYRTAIQGILVSVTVPSGFITDFASTPRILWPIFPPWDKYGKAAILHDYLYKYRVFERKLCDDIFYEAMKELKVPKWKRTLMFYAVRIFGASHYPKLKKIMK